MGNLRPGWTNKRYEDATKEAHMPSRHGCYWAAAEDKDLMKLVRRGFKPAYIAKLHDRSLTSVLMRIDLNRGHQKSPEYYKNLLINHSL